MADKSLNGDERVISYVAVAVGHQFHNTSLRPKVRQDPGQHVSGGNGTRGGYTFCLAHNA